VLNLLILLLSGPYLKRKIYAPVAFLAKKQLNAFTLIALVHVRHVVETMKMLYAAPAARSRFLSALFAKKVTNHPS
jgi:hypothetical protein